MQNQFIIDPYCDHIARYEPSSVVIYCYGNLEKLPIKPRPFIQCFDAWNPNINQRGLNFLIFGKSYNYVYNQRLGLPADTPTFERYARDCFRILIPRIRHIVHRDLEEAGISINPSLWL